MRKNTKKPKYCSFIGKKQRNEIFKKKELIAIMDIKSERDNTILKEKLSFLHSAPKAKAARILFISLERNGCLTSLLGKNWRYFLKQSRLNERDLLNDYQSFDLFFLIMFFLCFR